MADTPASQPLTHRRVLQIAFPIVLSNATVPILGAVDTGVIGQLGQAAPLGAVGLAAVIIGTLYWFFGFLRMGTTGMAAQALGQGDRREFTALFLRALLIGLAAGLALMLFQGAVFAAAFAVAPASPEVEGYARAYLDIRIWGAPATIALYGVTGWLIAQERTRAVLALQLWMNGLNIALDLWFVLGLGWGIEGVAIATLIAEWTGLALGVWLCRSAFAGTVWRDHALIFDRARLRAMALLNSDILIRSMLLQAIFLGFVFTGAHLGDKPLAANQVLMQFLEITAFAMDGFAFAAEALVGQAMGARDPKRLRRAAIMSGQWGFGCCVFLAIVFAVCGGALIDVMTTAPDLRSEARTYLPYMVLSPLLGAAAWMFDGIFIGAGRGRHMRNMMAISFVIYAVAVVVLVPPFGNHGLWIAMLISFVARGVTLYMCYPALERAAHPDQSVSQSV